MNLTVCIPTYNEGRTLTRIVEAVAGCTPLVQEIIVINDGSTDNTRLILNELQTQWNHPDISLQVIHLERNLGKGAAVRAGYAAATQSHILIQDADLELTPEDFPTIVRPIQEGRAEVVFGNRFPEGYPKEIPVLSRAANFIVTGLSNLLFGMHLKDQACGYKLLPTLLARELNLQSNGFEICSEITAKLGLRQTNIVNVPVRYLPRTLNEGKKIRWKDGLIAIQTLIRFRL